MSRTKQLFLILAALLAVSRLCHITVLWEGDTLPLAAAREMLHGKVLYRDIWFDKPPLLPAIYILWGARPGWPLRLGGALYGLLACWLAYRFARDLWSEREGLWAAGLLGFFLIFDFPSAVIPVASDLLLLAPHIAAVWLAWKNRPFLAGLMAGVAFWINPKGVFIAAAALAWNPAGLLPMAGGFATVSAIMLGWLGAAGALGPYWEQVWRWGRLYAGSTFIESPIWNGIQRTLSWMGFHAAIVLAAARFLWGPAPARNSRWWRTPWILWLAFAIIGVTTGMRFFPRYYFLLLAPTALMAARGFTLWRGRGEFVALLLLIPATRFGPSYLAAIRNPQWRDTSMDRDSRSAAQFTRSLAKPGDTLFIWGYRPEIYAYTGLPAATMYLDCQPLTGVPADRHLTHSEPVETDAPGQRRAMLAQSKPTFVLDGLGLYNPALAITNYPDLHNWLSHYHEVCRIGQTVIYQRNE